MKKLSFSYGFLPFENVIGVIVTLFIFLMTLYFWGIIIKSIYNHGFNYPMIFAVIMLLYFQYSSLCSLFFEKTIFYDDTSIYIQLNKKESKKIPFENILRFRKITINHYAIFYIDPEDQIAKKVIYWFSPNIYIGRPKIVKDILAKGKELRERNNTKP